MKSSKIHQYLISICSVIMVVAAGCVLLPFIDYKIIAFLLLVTVSVLAMVFDIFPVLLAAILSALLWDFFFIPPRFTFSIGSTEDRIMLSMYFVIALVNAALTYKIRQMEKEAQKKRIKEKAIYLYNTLFNSLSHELQTPISTIIGAADALKDNNKLSDKNKDDLINEISIASLRLNQQVSNLLNMSRVESGHLKLKKDWCDIDELIYAAINKLQKNRHSIKVVIPENFPLFKLDFGIMEQVLSNILNNAIQYTSPDTCIYIHVRYTTTMRGHFDLDENVSDAHRDETKHILVMTITDNGPGFPETELEKVFDKFYRLSSTRTGGTGLGLSIVKGFVEAHSGRISLKNVQAGGAQFTIEIPAEASFMNALKNE